VKAIVLEGFVASHSGAESIPVLALASLRGTGEEKRKAITHRGLRAADKVQDARKLAEGFMAMAAPTLPNPKVSPAVTRAADTMRLQQPVVVRTEVHAMPTGMGSRSVRRRTTPEAGFALEVLGHAIEYLADEYVHEGGILSSIESPDPRVEALRLLMAANREVYYACPVMPSLYQRVVGRLFGGSPA
jgi:hypothetical protein